jgi:hypothetical protein
MTGRGTRRVFLGAGVAAAAGAAITRLPEALSQDAPAGSASLALETRDLAGTGASPAFGTLRPGAGGESALHGTVHDRSSKRRAGTVSITAIPTSDGMLRVHTLELHDGSLVAIGGDRGNTFAIASGSGAYSTAQGSVTVKNAARAALHLDVELKL